jgi:hypothetical protein
MSELKITAAPSPSVLAVLLHNGAAVRAVVLAVSTVVLIALERRTLVPIAVSLYAIANAYALTRAAVKSQTVLKA